MGGAHFPVLEDLEHLRMRDQPGSADLLTFLMCPSRSHLLTRAAGIPVSFANCSGLCRAKSCPSHFLLSARRCSIGRRIGYTRNCSPFIVLQERNDFHTPIGVWGVLSARFKHFASSSRFDGRIASSVQPIRIIPSCRTYHARAPKTSREERSPCGAFAQTGRCGPRWPAPASLASGGRLSLRFPIRTG